MTNNFFKNIILKSPFLGAFILEYGQKLYMTSNFFDDRIIKR